MRIPDISIIISTTIWLYPRSLYQGPTRSLILISSLESDLRPRKRRMPTFNCYAFVSYERVRLSVSPGVNLETAYLGYGFTTDAPTLSSHLEYIIECTIAWCISKGAGNIILCLLGNCQCGSQLSLIPTIHYQSTLPHPVPDWFQPSMSQATVTFGN
jgi:hypothetical protein